ncbi:MAG TPA: nodulation protein NfeD [Thermoanaerobaculia bacterium]|nr:nodulation protein NfeD [Thermoanaerobaculia bacterium]
MRSSLLALGAAVVFAAAVSGSVGKLTLDQMIMPVTEEILDRALEISEEAGHEALLIQLSTPGGLETSTRQIVNRILTSPIPVIVWVAPSGERAASAGFFILLAADAAVMAPGTNTGAAHPVVLGTEIDEVMREKMASDSAALIRTIATRRGRNVAEAESAVRSSVSFTEEEALEKGLIDRIAADDRAVLEAVDGMEIRRFDGETIRLEIAGDEIHSIPLTLRQRVLSFIMNPNVAFVLLSLGMLALWAEFQNPGAILPGTVGALSILLAIIALNVLPTRYAALALVLAAFAFFGLEAKFASNGIFGIAGVISMTVGATLLVDGPIPEMRVSWATALAVSIPLGIIAVFLMSLALRAMKERVTTGEAGMTGEIGVAQTALEPAGKVFVHGELWNAVASRPVAAGERVRVTRVREEDLRIEVEPADASPGVPASPRNHLISGKEPS